MQILMQHDTELCIYFRLVLEQGRRSFFIEINWDSVVKGSLQTTVLFFPPFMCSFFIIHSVKEYLSPTSYMYGKYYTTQKNVERLIQETYLSLLVKSPELRCKLIVTHCYRKSVRLCFHNKYSGDANRWENARRSTGRRSDANVPEILLKPKKIWPSL